MGRKSTLSVILKVFLYGIINFVVVLALISVTKYNRQGTIQDQIVPILIIIFVTGLVDYIVINKKLL